MSRRLIASITPRTDFGKPPPGYIPGLGRGAVGFTTRSDIGPARPAVPDNARAKLIQLSRHAPPGAPPSVLAAAAAAANGMIPGAGPSASSSSSSAAASSSSSSAAAAAARAAPSYNEANFDAFSGFSERLFGDDEEGYTAEDREADEVYASIDQRLEEKHERRRERREARRREEAAKQPRALKRAKTTATPKIAEFRDLKKNLATLSEADWESIPEVKDLSRQNRLVHAQREAAYDKLSAAPDSLLRSKLAAVQPQRTHVVNDGGQTDLTQLSRARDKVMSMQLDHVADNVGGQTVVDSKGYLTSLSSIKLNSAAEISDIKKARLLLDSVRTTNPQHPPAWIATARLEAETGKVLRARTLILKGCKACPKSEDVWLEAARLHPPDDAKTILARAVRHLPKSVRIWLAARDREPEGSEARKAILRRALDMIPDSERLWKAAIEQESPDDARIMLSRAVECVPTSVDMWLALARLETYENAKKVLNRARRAVPNEPTIWITAAMLEEANERVQNIDKLIKGAVRTMKARGVVVGRDVWLKEAQAAEESGALETCRALVRHTIGLGVEDADRKKTWLNDAERLLAEGSVETARAAYAHSLEAFPQRAEIWFRAVDLERKHGGGHEAIDALLCRATFHVPSNATLWLMCAKERWLAGNVDGARKTLQDAFGANPGDEDIWLAAVKLESENQEYERAQLLLQKARDKAGTPRVWMKSALLARALRQRDDEIRLIEEGLAKFPHYAKLWLMRAHFYQFGCAEVDTEQVRHSFRRGVANCPTSVPVWVAWARFECTHTKLFPRARAILEQARQNNPKSDELFLEAVRVEQRVASRAIQEQVLARALQECRSSGRLWAQAIAAAPRPQRKARSYEALKHCSEDPHAICAVARLFWLDGKKHKARDWFRRAAKLEPDLGDTWAFWYQFELQFGTAEQQADVVRQCCESAPTHGELWTKFSKDYMLKRSVPTEQLLKLAASAIKEHFPLYYD